MSVLSVTQQPTGQVGVNPNVIQITTNDTYATVTVTGYLTTFKQAANLNVFANDQMALVYTSDEGPVWLKVVVTSNTISLVQISSPGDVILPTIASNIIVSTDTAGTLANTTGTAINRGSLQAGLSGNAGTLISFPNAATSGSLIVAAVTNASGDFSTTISNAAAVAQTQVITIPDSGTSSSKFVLQNGNNTALSVLNLKYGATPVAQVDPGSCTITAVAGASNVATVTVQLKDGSGTNIAGIIPFRVYSSSASNGLTLQSAASTGYSVASGGLSLNNGAAITTQISCMSSATGSCVLSLTDTGKQTSYLVLVLANGTKISTQLSAGSYGA